MQSALISTLAPTYNSSGLESGYSIVQLVPLGDDFPVNSDFFWADAPDLATSGTYYYETSSSTVVVLPRYYSTVPIVNSLGVETSPAGTEIPTSPGTVLPATITTLTPPAPPTQGQTLYFYGGAWVVSSFDPSLTLPDAKTSLINTVRSYSASAVDTEVGLYSAVQLINAPSVSALETKTYQPATLGEYQTYTDGLTASATATINAATSTTALYSFNPAEIPFTPESGSSGVINIGRGQFGGPLDLNASNYVTFNSVSMTEAETELYAPATSSVVPYQGFPPDDFNSSGPIFTTGNYLIQIRETATSMVIAEFEVPLSLDGTNEDVVF